MPGRGEGWEDGTRNLPGFVPSSRRLNSTVRQKIKEKGMVVWIENYACNRYKHKIVNGAAGHGRQRPMTGERIRLKSWTGP